MENKKLLSISIIIFAISVIISSIWIGYSLQKSVSLQTSSLLSKDNIILTLSQVAEYLNMTEEEVLSIIKLENKKLDETGSFTGIMFPYFKINNKNYFYKEEINEWVKEVSRDHRVYNTIEGSIR